MPHDAHDDHSGWLRASERTPHGSPIELEARDIGGETRSFDPAPGHPIAWTPD